MCPPVPRRSSVDLLSPGRLLVPPPGVPRFMVSHRPPTSRTRPIGLGPPTPSADVGRTFDQAVDGLTGQKLGPLRRHQQRPADPVQLVQSCSGFEPVLVVVNRSGQSPTTESIRRRYSPVGTRSSRSHRAKVPGSTRSHAANSFCDTPCRRRYCLSVCPTVSPLGIGS